MVKSGGTSRSEISVPLFLPLRAVCMFYLKRVIPFVGRLLLGDPQCYRMLGSYTQAFQNGTITVTNGVPALTATTDPYYSTLIASPWLGSATTAKSCSLAGGSCYSGFQNGWIVSSSATSPEIVFTSAPLSFSALAYFAGREDT